MSQAEELKWFILDALSQLDYDSLLEIEATIKADKKTYPEEQYY